LDDTNLIILVLFEDINLILFFKIIFLKGFHSPNESIILTSYFEYFLKEMAEFKTAFVVATLDIKGAQ
jgi:hypothetical protein